MPSRCRSSNSQAGVLSLCFQEGSVMIFFFYFLVSSRPTSIRSALALMRFTFTSTLFSRLMFDTFCLYD
ncbi:hypothetical protein BJ322DRAFT_1089801 [Thelephora terrestris]|uniref:Uncharacterized protein n=1 Tax=Thelephora terrestris TaxID=56493 RepID=A0A9P6L2H4_9AGAM|nr:hypothetical protein BJ322DRAFT_1089801 [Thelephora terrestris]